MITLRTIHLENFMSIDSLDLSFDDDTIISISGRNGNGKSSLIYAIALCITGYRYGDSYKNEIKRGSEEAKIYLEAELKGYPIIYDLTLKTKGNPLSRKVTYKGITYNNSDYDDFMKENDLDYIEDLMFLFQSKDNLINIKPAERATTLRKLFQFEFPDIVNKFKEKQELNKISNVEINSVINELGSRIYETKPLLRVLNPSIIDEYSKRIEEITTDLSKINNVSFEDYSERIKSLESYVNESYDVIHSMESKLFKLNPVDPPKALDIDEKDSEKAKEDVGTIKKDLYRIEIEFNNLKNQVEMAKKGICHSCGQSIPKKHVDSLIKKQNEKNEELNATRNRLEECVRIYNEISTKISRYNLEKNKYDKYIREKEQNEVILSNMKMRQQLIDKTVEEINGLKEKQKNNESLIKLREKKDSLIKEKDELNEKINRANEVVITNRERIKTNNDIIKQRDERDKRVLELSDQLNNNIKNMDITKQCIDIFDSQFPNFILLRACSQLEEYINSIIERVFEGFRVRLNQSRSGVNFYYKTSRIGDDDEWIPVCMASGAEKKILSLAYTIALGKMYGLNCILLDEVDGSCDTESAKDIYKFITSLKDFNQIIFISHNKDVRDIVKESDKNILYYTVSKGVYELDCNN